MCILSKASIYRMIFKYLERKQIVDHEFFARLRRVKSRTNNGNNHQFVIYTFMSEA